MVPSARKGNKTAARLGGPLLAPQLDAPIINFQSFLGEEERTVTGVDYNPMERAKDHKAIRGSSINDVTQIWRFFITSPPLSY